MKMKIYSKYLMAPLSLLMVLACSPDQYHKKGEYDDVYFTRNDRKQQPEIVTQNQAIVAQQLGQTNSQTTVPTELQERYSNNTGPVTYYEEQGARVQSARDLNYDDFLYDYENGYLAYYDLPLDWDSDWSKESFDLLMSQDFQFSMAWYDQYYEGDDFRMRQYLNGQSGRASRNWNPASPQVGIGMGFNTFGPPGFYPGGMMAVDLNPWGFYDPFWRPIPTQRFNAGLGFGFGWANPYYCPTYAPIYTGNPGGIIVVNDNNVNVDNRTIVRGGRLSGTSVNSVQTDSQNGAQIRSRSQRIVQRGGNASGGGTLTQIQRTSSGRVVAAGRTARTSSNGSSAVRTTRADLTADNVRRVNTDAYRFDNRSSRGSRNPRNRISASQVSSGRSATGSSRAGRTSSYTRADITRASASRSSRNNSYSRLSFDRNSSSSISRSVSNRSSFNRSTSNSRNRGFSFGSNSRNSGFSRSSGTSFSRGSSSRSTGSFSRGSSSRSSSSGVSRSSSGSSRSSSSSSGSSRSGRN